MRHIYAAGLLRGGRFSAARGGRVWVVGGCYLVAILVETHLVTEKGACSGVAEIAAGRFLARSGFITVIRSGRGVPRPKPQGVPSHPLALVDTVARGVPRPTNRAQPQRSKAYYSGPRPPESPYSPPPLLQQSFFEGM